MAEKGRNFPPGVRTLAVEGIMGVGKSEFCAALAERLSAALILDSVDENPFLSKFYKNRSHYAFQTQMWFLLSRYRQLSESLPQQDLFRDGVVIDYLFAKDRVFATVNLDDKELALYDTIARILDKDIPPPDYVVYLQASTETLMKRIEKRGRPFEFNMDFHYTDALNRAFNHFFFHYTASPLLIINTNNIDMADLDERDELIDEILRARPGCNYYQPLASAEHSWLLKKSKDREAKGRGEEGEIGGQEDIVL